jgi:hypothetical protein
MKNMRGKIYFLIKVVNDDHVLVSLAGFFDRTRETAPKKHNSHAEYTFWTNFRLHQSIVTIDDATDRPIIRIRRIF